MHNRNRKCGIQQREMMLMFENTHKPEQPMSTFTVYILEPLTCFISTSSNRYRVTVQTPAKHIWAIMQVEERFTDKLSTDH